MFKRALFINFYSLLAFSLLIFSLSISADDTQQPFSPVEFIAEENSQLDDLNTNDENQELIKSLETQNNLEPDTLELTKQPSNAPEPQKEVSVPKDIEEDFYIAEDIEKQKQYKKELLEAKPKTTTVEILEKQPTLSEKNNLIARPQTEEWILIDTQKMQLEVKRGNKTLAVFKNLAIGRNGAGFKNKRGDDITPLGTYKIGWVNTKSPFKTFYGFTYPSVENAQQALKKGLINQQNYQAIIDAHKNNRIPPQNTPLGGRIGLHGLGKGNKEIHQVMNWTHGCIAVTNEQIDQLGQWIREGMEVKVK